MTGYRAWRPGTNRLFAVSRAYEWSPGVNHAECSNLTIEPVDRLHGPHIPGIRCQCGIWSLQTLKEAVEYLHHPPYFVYGTILAWGKMIEHERGFRSEYGQVTGLYDPRRIQTASFRYIRDFQTFLGAFTETAKHLSKVYDVPLLDPPDDLLLADFSHELV